MIEQGPLVDSSFTHDSRSHEIRAQGTGCTAKDVHPPSASSTLLQGYHPFTMSQEPVQLPPPVQPHSTIDIDRTSFQPMPSLASSYFLPAYSSASSHFRPVSSSTSSLTSFLSPCDDVLAPGDIIGEGLRLHGNVVRRVPIPASSARPSREEPAPTFEIVRLLDSGSDSAVYLVREVLYRAPTTSASSDDGMESDTSLDGHNELDIGVESEYGREYAIKVLRPSVR